MHGFGLVPIWTTPPKFLPRPHVAGVTSRFPQKWPTICGAVFDNYFGYDKEIRIWNSEHSIISHIDSESWDWCAKTFPSSLDPLPQRDEVLSRRSRASAWMIRCLSNNAHELWDGLRDRDPIFLQDLWQVLFPEGEQTRSKEKVICQWVESSVSGRLRILDPNGWVAVHPWKEQEDTIIKEYLPDPGLEWRVIVQHQQGDIGRKTVV